MKGRRQHPGGAVGGRKGVGAVAEQSRDCGPFMVAGENLLGSDLGFICSAGEEGGEMQAGRQAGRSWPRHGVGPSPRERPLSGERGR